ncbi:hypothetical protein BGZ49_003739 [Haplosporangium sp. Z 27]|nr:hypothetical protein BGZ49_003739 [Haplosporangium sp. Z 27]
MELDEAPAPTSRLDHLAELATSPSHANVHPPTSASSTSSTSSSRQYTRSKQPSQDDSRNSRSSPPISSSTSMKDTRASSPVAHHSRPQIIREQLEAESGPAWGRSPITPTTTNKFNRMAIHEVLEAPGRNHSHHNEEGRHSPPYKRKGSPEDSFSDPPSNPRARSTLSSSTSRGPSYNTNSDHPHPHFTSRHPRSPRYRHESPMPQSNSDDDEDSDVRNYKKRRMLASSSSSNTKMLSSSPPSSSGPPEVMDQVRSTLKLKQQQKAIIEARQSGASTPTTTAPSSSLNSKPKETSAPSSSSSNGNTGTSSQPVTEKTSSGISVFHGSASFAALNRRPLTSPRNPKNAKSLTIFAPSYSDSSLSIQSAPLQPSHGAMLNHRASQPIRNHTPHPFSQQQHTGTIPHPLRSPKTAGHNKKVSRVTLRAGPQTAGLDTSSGTLPAPILSSHTGPLPSPAMYPIPPTPFHPPSHGPPAHMSKPAFMETISNLFDSVDSSRSLRFTLEEQIRKSAQLLQTLQSSGTMIESLVRGQFKELEKGVLEKFEGELEYLSTRVRLLEEHQGLTPPPKKARVSTTTPSKNNSSSSAMTGVTSTTVESTASNGSLPSPPSGSSKVLGTSVSELKEGTLPTPPFNKNQDSAMEVEDEEPSTVSSTSTSASSSPPRDQPSEYHSSVKKLQERVASLEKRQETTAQA